ncbi:MAG: SMC-Scp complex subunit ScpB, partial [Rhodospirillaceae bacterium]
RTLEALLFASKDPLSLKDLARRLPEKANLRSLLKTLQEQYANRGVNLSEADGTWAFRTAPDLAAELAEEAPEQRRLSRAAVETLSVIAYHQPVTRAEIEDVRGVALSKGTMDTLLEAGWIKPLGRRQVPGRPLTWGTSAAFLDHFGLTALEDLPGVEELKAAGLLDSRPSLAAYGARAQDEGVLEDIGEDEEALLAEKETIDASRQLDLLRREPLDPPEDGKENE